MHGRNQKKRNLHRIISLTAGITFLLSPLLVSVLCPSHLMSQAPKASDLNISSKAPTSHDHHDHGSHQHATHDQTTSRSSHEAEGYSHSPAQDDPTCCSDGVKKDFIPSSPPELSYREWSKRINSGLGNTLPINMAFLHPAASFIYYGHSPPRSLISTPLYSQYSSLLI